MNSTQPIVELRKVSKDFSGIFALEQVDLKISPGLVTAIIGENGAGKSTLMKIIAGVITEFEGQVLLNQKKISFKNPRDASKEGVAIIHQELNLISHLSITENLFLGQELVKRSGFLDYPRMQKKTKSLLERLQLDVHPSTPVNRLRVGQQQLVEIAKALLQDSRVLIMDEPTSAISDHEVENLFTIINDLKARGVAIVYISHKLNELFTIADHYAVLRDGKLTGTGKIKGTSQDQLIQMMVGRKVIKHFDKTTIPGLKEVLRVENLNLRNPENKKEDLVSDVSFSLHEGEVLGLAGLMGSGRTEVLEAIFGLFPKFVSGKIYVEGKEKKIGKVSDAINAGLALVPEDRKLQGLILNMDVAKNTSLANLHSVSRWGFINNKKEEELSKIMIGKLKIRVPSEKIEVQKLSGGNQQKVVIAKWLATNPKILLLDEPTRGIDVGAKAEIYKLINELAAQGLGIVLVSSELPEILALSDHIIVLSASKLTARFSREEATEKKIMKAALIEMK